MRIFALETDKDKIVQRFCHEGECMVLMSYYHIFHFILPIIKEIALFTAIVTGMVTGLVLGWPASWVLGISGLLFVGLVLFPTIKSYIDWYYDFILVTTDKVILVDQTSIFKQEIKPIHIENIGSVSTETQFWDIFDFGMIIINLKEGEGGDKIMRPFVPNAKEVAGKISDVVTRYQRGMFAPAAPSHRAREPFPEQAEQPPAPALESQPAPPPPASPAEQRQHLAKEVFEQATQPGVQPPNPTPVKTSE